MKRTMKGALALLIIVSLLLPLLAACGDDDEDKTPTVTTPPGTTPAQTTPAQTTPAKDVTLTIGNLTDLTGPTAMMNEAVNIALADLVQYFNDEKLIPGVKLEIETYDAQMDPSKDIPGYEWLKGRGADMIVCALPSIAVSLYPRLTADKIPLFDLSAPDEVAKAEPGWAFLMNTRADAIGLTQAKWIADNDWDWKTKGPAKIGGASWDEPWSGGILRGMEAYAKAHPEQFEWVGTYLTQYSVRWDAEVEALKNADYVMPAVTGFGFTSFIKEYGAAGGKAKFICNEGNTASMNMVDQSGMWNLVDGAFVIQANRALGEDTDINRLLKEVTYRYHSQQEADEILSAAGGGLNFIGSWRQWYGILTLLGEAVKKAGGAEKFTTQALYDTANNYSVSFEGTPDWSWTPTKRTAWNAMAMYEYSAAKKLAIPVGGGEPEWVPIIYEP